MKNFYSLLIFTFLVFMLSSYAGGQLVMQCEFTDFFQDFKIRGAVGLSSQHPFMKKIHADTTLVGLIYHPSVGLYCGALPLPEKENDKKKGVARVAALMWPYLFNGTRDRVIHHYRNIMGTIATRVEYTEKKDYTDVIITEADIVLRDYADNVAVVQQVYEAVRESIASITDTKQKKLLEYQIRRLETCLGNHTQKGLS